MWKEPKFRQPKGFKGLSFDPDEIPGMTGFIYRENRFRLPHEYRGNKENPLAPICKHLGLSEDSGLQTICSTYDRLEADLASMEKRNTTLASSNKCFQDRHEALVKTRAHLQEVVSTMEQDIKRKNEELHTLRQQKELYGTHTKDCNWVNILQSGRVYGTEKEQCNCGWL